MRHPLILTAITAVLMISATSALPLQFSEFAEHLKDLAHEIWDAVSDAEHVAPSERPFLNLTRNDTGLFSSGLHSLSPRDESTSEASRVKPAEALLVHFIHPDHHKVFGTVTNGDTDQDTADDTDINDEQSSLPIHEHSITAHRYSSEEDNEDSSDSLPNNLAARLPSGDKVGNTPLRTRNINGRREAQNSSNSVTDNEDCDRVDDTTATPSLTQVFPMCNNGQMDNGASSGEENADEETDSSSSIPTGDPSSSSFHSIVPLNDTTDCEDSITNETDAQPPQTDNLLRPHFIRLQGRDVEAMNKNDTAIGNNLDSDFHPVATSLRGDPIDEMGLTAAEHVKWMALSTRVKNFPITSLVMHSIRIQGANQAEVVNPFNMSTTAGVGGRTKRDETVSEANSSSESNPENSTNSKHDYDSDSDPVDFSASSEPVDDMDSPPPSDETFPQIDDHSLRLHFKGPLNSTKEVNPSNPSTIAGDEGLMKRNETVSQTNSGSAPEPVNSDLSFKPLTIAEYKRFLEILGKSWMANTSFRRSVGRRGVNIPNDNNVSSSSFPTISAADAIGLTPAQKAAALVISEMLKSIPVRLFHPRQKRSENGTAVDGATSIEVPGPADPTAEQLADWGLTLNQFRSIVAWMNMLGPGPIQIIRNGTTGQGNIWDKSLNISHPISESVQDEPVEFDHVSNSDSVLPTQQELDAAGLTMDQFMAGLAEWFVLGINPLRPHPIQHKRQEDFQNKVVNGSDPTQQQLAAMNLTSDQYRKGVAFIKKLGITPIRFHSMILRQNGTGNTTDSIFNLRNKTTSLQPSGLADFNSTEEEQLQSLLNGNQTPAVHFIHGQSYDRRHRLARRKESTTSGTPDSTDAKNLLVGLGTGLNFTGHGLNLTTAEKVELGFGQNLRIHSIIQGVGRRGDKNVDGPFNGSDPISPSNTVGLEDNSEEATGVGDLSPRDLSKLSPLALALHFQIRREESGENEKTSGIHSTSEVLNLIPEQRKELQEALSGRGLPERTIIKPSIEQRSEEISGEDVSDEEGSDQEGSDEDGFDEEDGGSDPSTEPDVHRAAKGGIRIGIHGIQRRQDGSPNNKESSINQQSSNSSRTKIHLLPQASVTPGMFTNATKLENSALNNAISNKTSSNDHNLSEEDEAWAAWQEWEENFGSKIEGAINPIHIHSIGRQQDHSSNKTSPDNHTLSEEDQSDEMAAGLSSGINVMDRGLPHSTQSITKRQNETSSNESQTQNPASEEPSSNAETSAGQATSEGDASEFDAEAKHEAWIRAWQELLSHQNLENGTTAGPLFPHFLPGHKRDAVSSDDIPVASMQDLKARSMTPKMKADWMEYLKQPYTTPRPMHKHSINRRQVIGLPDTSDSQSTEGSPLSQLRFHPVAHGDNDDLNLGEFSKEETKFVPKPGVHFGPRPVFHKDVVVARDNPFSHLGDWIEQKAQDAADWVTSTISGGQDSDAAPTEDQVKIGHFALRPHYQLADPDDAASTGEKNRRETQIVKDQPHPGDDTFLNPMTGVHGLMRTRDNPPLGGEDAQVVEDGSVNDKESTSVVQADIEPTPEPAYRTIPGNTNFLKPQHFHPIQVRDEEDPAAEEDPEQNSEAPEIPHDESDPVVQLDPEQTADEGVILDNGSISAVQADNKPTPESTVVNNSDNPNPVKPLNNPQRFHAIQHRDEEDPTTEDIDSEPNSDTLLKLPLLKPFHDHGPVVFPKKYHWRRR